MKMLQDQTVKVKKQEIKQEVRKVLQKFFQLNKLMH